MCIVRYCYISNEFIVIILLLLLLLSGCASSIPHHINLMPAPDVYDENGITPFTDTSFIQDSPYTGMLYATDRAPVDSNTEKESEDRFYTNERGQLLRFGVADIELGKDDFSWEEARRISLAKNRPDKYPLRISEVDELGIYHGSYHQFVKQEQLAFKSHEPAKKFATLINKKLAISKVKEIFIYVPGYKVVFENPVLVATELWHYLGYEGVFVAFAWPSTPEQLAYFADAETTITSASHLRVFLEYLAQETSAERINIVAYSQGTRLVTTALHSMALLHHGKTRNQVQKKLRIGNVILIGSDIERGVMGTYILDGLLNIPAHLTVYVSEKDKALGVSQFFYRRSRMGQMFAQVELDPPLVKFLQQTPELSIINVTAAEGATSENGHRYFRKSPWASSDLLMTLRYGLSPDERGLVRSDDSPIWTFPPDYIERLRSAIINSNPSLNLK